MVTVLHVHTDTRWHIWGAELWVISAVSRKAAPPKAYNHVSVWQTCR